MRGGYRFWAVDRWGCNGEWYLRLCIKWKEGVEEKVEIPDHVDPPFRTMLTHYSGKVTHLVFYKFKTQYYGYYVKYSGMVTHP